MKDVAGKVAFITGGGSGIGLGMADTFARNGMKVVIADIRKEALDEAMAGFKDTNLAVYPVELDVGDRKAWERAADEAEAQFGKIHVLCNNAGIGGTGALKDATFDDWDWLKSVMLDGVFNGFRTILPRLRAHGEGGHIVNTASMAGMFATENGGVYTTMKYGVVGLSESLRRELAGENIGVSVFMPGGVQTNIGTSHHHRPAHYKTGFSEMEARMDAARATAPVRASGGQGAAPNPAMANLVMDKYEAGRRILRGIRRNDLFIFSHPEFREGVEARMQALLRAFPDEPLNEARLKYLRERGSLKGLQEFYGAQTTPKGAPDEHGE